MLRRQRLDQKLAEMGLASSRSQAESVIKLGSVKVNTKVITKPGFLVSSSDNIQIAPGESYVSRAGLKLASVSQRFGLDFTGKTVLDVGSSTGGFTDYALRRGAKKVIAVDVGTNQLHPSLHSDERIELHEQTDIREVGLWKMDDISAKKGSPPNSKVHNLKSSPDIVLIDVSFISLREILPHISKLTAQSSIIVAMLKPQFEAGDSHKHKGVIKNNTLRRQIIKDFEQWLGQYFVLMNKADSDVAGAKGNVERFYLLKKLK